MAGWAWGVSSEAPGQSVQTCVPKTEVAGACTPQELAPSQAALPARLPARLLAGHPAPRRHSVQRHRHPALARRVLLHDTSSRQPACPLDFTHHDGQIASPSCRSEEVTPPLAYIDATAVTLACSLRAVN